MMHTLSKARYQTKEEIIEIFKKAIRIFVKDKDKDMVQYFIIETIIYIISSREDFQEEELKEIASQISKEGGELFMTLAERLMEKGIERGREEGRKEGRKESIEKVAINLLREGTEISLVAKATGLSRSQIEKLRSQLM